MHFGCLHQGWLTKMGENVKNWKRRFFILQADHLLYFGRPTDDIAKGSIALASVLHVRTCLHDYRHHADRKFCFAVFTARRTYYFVAPTFLDMTEWVQHIETMTAVYALQEAHSTAAAIPPELRWSHRYVYCCSLAAHVRTLLPLLMKASLLISQSLLSAAADETLAAAVDDPADAQHDADAADATADAAETPLRVETAEQNSYRTAVVQTFGHTAIVFLQEIVDHAKLLLARDLPASSASVVRAAHGLLALLEGLVAPVISRLRRKNMLTFSQLVRTVVAVAELKLPSVPDECSSLLSFIEQTLRTIDKQCSQHRRLQRSISFASSDAAVADADAQLRVPVQTRTDLTTAFAALHASRSLIASLCFPDSPKHHGLCLLIVAKIHQHYLALDALLNDQAASRDHIKLAVDQLSRLCVSLSVFMPLSFD